MSDPLIPCQPGALLLEHETYKSEMMSDMSVAAELNSCGFARCGRETYDLLVEEVDYIILEVIHRFE